MITVKIAKIRTLGEEEAEAIISTLSEAARERVDKKKNGKVRERSLCALALLDESAREALAYSLAGKPRLTSIGQRVSISHSDTFVAVAIGDLEDGRIGIDIEDDGMSPERAERISKMYSDEERASGYSATEIWTRREAIYKCLSGTNREYKTVASTDSASAERRGLTLLTTKTQGGATISICTKHKDVKIEIEELE